MKLFQYWDTGEPPEDVAECIQSVRDLNPEFDHQLFDRNSAAFFIGKRIGHREREAFSALAMPAMQADYFRLCALWAKGGLWIDADERCIRPFKTMLAEAPNGYVSMFFNLLQASPLYFPAPGSPFLRAVIELATRHIEARMAGQSYWVTGPAVLNHIWAAVDPAGAHDDPHRARDPEFKPSPEAEAVAALHPGAAEAVAGLVRRHDHWTYQWLTEEQRLAYKATPNDWRKWEGSAYLDGRALEVVSTNR
jgi:mannosyltransferase OCH1-like enzyme